MSIVQSLTMQGALITSVIQAPSRSAICVWSSSVENLPAVTFKLIRKALLNQLPAASNLVRWVKFRDYNCPLCMHENTNKKHVLSNCGSLAVLVHYRHRHDDVLKILAPWIKSTLRLEYTLHVDLFSIDYLPISNIFVSKRPDIAIVGRSSIVTLELTVCHETNLIRSKQYKDTTLGFISNITAFTRKYLTNSLPQTITNNITISAITNSMYI